MAASVAAIFVIPCKLPESRTLRWLPAGSRRPEILEMVLTKCYFSKRSARPAVSCLCTVMHRSKTFLPIEIHPLID